MKFPWCQSVNDFLRLKIFKFGPRKFNNIREYFTTPSWKLTGETIHGDNTWNLTNAMSVGQSYYLTLTTSNSLLTSNMVMFLLVLFFCSSIINTVGKVLKVIFYTNSDGCKEGYCKYFFSIWQFRKQQQQQQQQQQQKQQLILVQLLQECIILIQQLQQHFSHLQYLLQDLQYLLQHFSLLEYLQQHFSLLQHLQQHLILLQLVWNLL